MIFLAVIFLDGLCFKVCVGEKTFYFQPTHVEANFFFSFKLSLKFIFDLILFGVFVNELKSYIVFQKLKLH